MTNSTRIEHDPFGPVEVPAGALYGAQTVRALANFPQSGLRVYQRPDFVRAFAFVKAAAADANAELGIIDRGTAAAVVSAAEELAAGRWHEHLPLALVQGGGGTATNMAVNEVLANRSAQILGGEPGRYDVVHPLGHVNRSQSTNDVYPTAMQLAALERAAEARARLEQLACALEEQANAAVGLTRLGRTCLQDALPVPISAYHAAQAGAVRRAVTGLAHAEEPLLQVPLGATAVGTGFGAPDGYRELVVERLAARAGLPLKPNGDPFDALAHLDPLLALATAAATASITLAKIAADLRFLSSGPVGGIGELRLPPVQVGSSIMPGKVNPVIPELVIQASFEIRGAAHVVESAVAAGELELNVMEPVIVRHLLEALEQLGETATLFAERCVAGLEWVEERLATNLAGSLAGAVERAMSLGHDHPTLGETGERC